MERLEHRASVTAPLTALALAAGAAVLFAVGNAVGFHSEAAEDVFIFTWLLGWVLLAWASIVGGGFAVVLGWRALSRRQVFGSEVTFAVAALALITLVVVSHPLWGTGSGSG
jgi:hypothetical protein